LEGTKMKVRVLFFIFFVYLAIAGVSIWVFFNVGLLLSIIILGLLVTGLVTYIGKLVENLSLRGMIDYTEYGGPKSPWDDSKYKVNKKIFTIFSLLFTISISSLYIFLDTIFTSISNNTFDCTTYLISLLVAGAGTMIMDFIYRYRRNVGGYQPPFWMDEYY